MFNRLFDDPPPRLRDMALDAQRQSQLPPDQAAAIIGAAHDQPLGHSPGDWPHFDQGFSLCERLVFTAQPYLFASRACAFEREGRHRLLANGLVTPTTAICNDAAAALGWVGPSVG